MYQKYHTEALVLDHRERGEADATVALYTRDFGLVWARASALRAEKSKMRYALQSYTHAHVSLVRGVSGWRAAGASTRSEALSGDGAYTFARIAALVTRLVAGEERNEYLFDVLAHARNVLSSGDKGSGEAASGGLAAHASIEIVTVARILYALGYLSAEALGEALFIETSYDYERLREKTMRDDLLFSINRALSATHLL